MRWLRSRRYEIVDRSMEPTLTPGDRVLVDGSAYRASPPGVGDLVALVDPADPGRWLVKRVVAVGPGTAAVPVEGGIDPLDVPIPSGTVYVLADARGSGRDSRQFGPVGLDRLRGKVWYRYSPPGSRGQLGDGPR